MANLLTGLVAGLARIGWGIRVPEVAVHHGAIMVGGFLGALISLEKAIPLKKNWLLLVPLCCALTPLMAVEDLHEVGLALLLAGSVGLAAIQLWYLLRLPHDRSAWLMVAGACCLVTGNCMLISSAFYPVAFPWWVAFILLTIVGERLELTKFLPAPIWATRLLIAFLFIFLLGLTLPFHSIGRQLSGIAIILVSLWMLRFDVIRVGLLANGLVRYSAIALLLANVSLMIEGLLLFTLPDGAFSYDTLVHLFFLGFGFSMIFAHGPIILPAVLGMIVRPYHSILYMWLTLLHISVTLRIVGNTTLNMELRRLSGALSALVILAYFLTVAITAFRSNRKTPS